MKYQITKTHLLLGGALFLFSLSLHGKAPSLADPNYTGPAAPTLALPDLALPSTKPFVHPGLLQSQSDIDFIRAKIKAGEEPWISALQAMKASPYAQLDYRIRIVPVIIPASNGSGYVMMDSSAAYAHALLWCITGEKAHADKAIAILNANSTTLQTIEVGQNNQGKLLAGFVAGKYAGAAELLSHYRQPNGETSHWAAVDIERCKKMLTTIFYPLIENFQPTYNGNWDASMMASMLSIGVLCDDHLKFNRAIDYYLHGKGNGAISHYIYSTGQCQESPRDQSHVQLGLGALAASCEIASKQGLDLYGMADDRLALGFEYTAKYNTGHEVEPVDPNLPVSNHGRGKAMPGYELIYQHYFIEKGHPMPFTKEMLDKNRPEGLDLIMLPAFGTLTAYRGPATKAVPRPSSK